MSAGVIDAGKALIDQTGAALRKAVERPAKRRLTFVPVICDPAIFCRSKCATPTADHCRNNSDGVPFHRGALLRFACNRLRVGSRSDGYT